MNRRSSKFERPTRTDHMGSAVFNAKDVHSMHQSLNSEFMLYQIILKRILSIDDRQLITRKGLHNYFQLDDEHDQRTLLEFDGTYKPNEAIHWYTRETCIYRMLNKALRTHNINHILGFGTFIRDLFNQLGHEQTLFVRRLKSPLLRVYRGQFISKDEVNRMKSGIGQLIAMNSFLSTSTNKSQALQFATSRSPPSDTLTSILLEIDIYVGGSTRPYADIKRLSAFPSEEEILLTFGSVFRIDDVREDKKRNIWRARLSLCNDDDEDFMAFKAILEKDPHSQGDLVSLGHYLIQMGKFDEAEEYYQTLLSTNLVTSDYDLANCRYGLACTNAKKGDYNLALNNINIALEYLLKKEGTKHHPLVSRCYNDCASIYCKKGHYINAFKYYEKALTSENNDASISFAGLAEIHIELGDYSQALEYHYKRLDQAVTASFSMIANVYIDIGKTYVLMGASKRASDMFSQAINCQLEKLSPGHPDLGYTYNAIGSMYLQLGNENRALEHFQKAYELQLQSLPTLHSDFYETFRNFGNLYLRKGDWSRALFYFEKLLESQLKSLSDKHPFVAETYLLIGKVYIEKKDFDKALTYYRKSLDSLLQKKAFGDPALSKMYQNMADINLKKGDFDGALINFQKILDNDLERKVLEDPSFIEIYQKMGEIYCKQGDFRHGLFYYYRLLDCQLQMRPFNESAVDNTYAIIGKIYMEKLMDQSLVAFNQCIENEEDPSSSTDHTLLEVHTTLGNRHFEKRHLDQTYHYFKRALDYEQKKGSPDKSLVVDTLKILGSICTDRRDFDQALHYYQDLLKYELKSKPYDHPSLINCYRTIGYVYYEKRDFDKGLFFYNYLLDCQLQIKSLNDSLVIDTYIKMGRIYSAKPFSQKLSHFNAMLGNLTPVVATTDLSFCSDSIKEGGVKPEHRHLDRLVKYFQDALNHSSPVETLKTLGHLTIEKMDWENALMYFNKMLEIQGSDDVASINSYKMLGLIYNEKHNYDQALLHFQKALNKELEKKGLVDASLSELYKTMGNIYRHQHDLKKALLYYNRLLDCLLQTKPFDESASIDTYTKVGQIYVDKPFDQTLLSFNLAKSRDGQPKSSSHPSLLDLHTRINSAHFEKEHLDRAMVYFEQICSKQLKDLSPTHPSLLNTYKILANICIEKQDVNQASTYLFRLLEIEWKHKKLTDPSLMSIYKAMTKIYAYKHDFDQGLLYVNRWLDCLLHKEPLNHVRLAEAYEMLGEIHLNHHRFDHTERCINKLYENHATKTPSIQDMYRVVLKVHLEKRHLDGTLNYFMQLLQIQEEHLAKQPSSLLRIYTIIKNIHLEKRDFLPAMVFFQQLLHQHRNRGVQEDLISANLYQMIGNLCHELGRNEEALKNYRIALAIFERLQAPNHSSIKKIKREIRKILVPEETL